jgi:NAD(P)H-dependent FMN reductase
MEGFTVRSTTHLVVVPPGVEFDPKAALAASSNSGGGNTADNAARNVLRGAFGRAIGGQQKQAEEKKADEKPRQVTLLRVLTEVRDVQSKALPASLFEIPAGYKEVPFQGLTDR